MLGNLRALLKERIQFLKSTILEFFSLVDLPQPTRKSRPDLNERSPVRHKNENKRRYKELKAAEN